MDSDRKAADPIVFDDRQIYDDLNAAILQAYRYGQLHRLAAGYARGATIYERQGEIDAACFFWTQAYILALDAGAEPLANAMYDKLSTLGRMG